MRVLVFGKQFKEKDLVFVQELFDALSEQKIDISVYEPYLLDVKDKLKLPGEMDVFESYEDFRAQRIDFVIVMGGDGTMLAAVTLVRDAGVPVCAAITVGRG